jgi:tripartite-type tricarboxylate transporter receptor subunit TctC
MRFARIYLIGVCNLAMALFAVHAIADQDAFKARQVKLIIGFGAGGGYDQYGRLVATYLEKYLRGRPLVVPQNMPGAGSIAAANTLYANSPKDGSVIGIIARDAVMEPLMDDSSGAKFDALTMDWLGSPTTETSVCIATDKSQVQSFADLLHKQFVVGGAGAGSGTEILPKALNGLIGTHFKVVGGYPGASEVFLAMDRGEVDGICSAYSAVMLKYADAIAAGKIRILFQAALAINPQVAAPFLPDLVESVDDRQALQFLYADQSMGWPFVAPPGLQPDVLATLRTAFDAAVRDPEFRAQAAKQKLMVAPVSGAQLEQVVRHVYATPKTTVERIRALLVGTE